jgi:hypothetical protein
VSMRSVGRSGCSPRRVLLGDFLDDLRGSGDLTRPVMLGEIGSPGAVVGTQTRVDRRSSLTALTA